MTELEYEKLTIYEVEDFHKDLMKILNNSSKECELDFKNIKKIDLAGIQLLLSASETFKQKNIGLKIHGLSFELMLALEFCGSKELLGDVLEQ